MLKVNLLFRNLVHELVGFIGFVMIPLFDLISKVLTGLDDAVLKPIKSSQEYYQTLLDASKK